MYNKNGAFQVLFSDNCLFVKDRAIIRCKFSSYADVSFSLPAGNHFPVLQEEDWVPRYRFSVCRLSHFGTELQKFSLVPSVIHAL